MIQHLIDTHFHLDYYKEHQKIYDGINERKQYTLCMTNSPGVYISCKRIYPETKYLKFALGFHPQDVSLKDADFYDFMQLVTLIIMTQLIKLHLKALLEKLNNEN